MKASTSILIVLWAALILAGCSAFGKGREIPDNDADGTLKPSPCACIEIDDYDGGGFEWRHA